MEGFEWPQAPCSRSCHTYIPNNCRRTKAPDQELYQPHVPSFRLCDVCSLVDFTKFAWRGELRLAEAFPGASITANQGCLRSNTAKRARLRPRLGSVDEIFERARSCDLCNVIKRRLQEGQFVKAVRISIQSQDFCHAEPEINAMPADDPDHVHPVTSLPDAGFNRFLRGYFQLDERLQEIQRPKTITTNRLTVIVELEKEDTSIYSLPDYDAEILVTFQPCSPSHIPTVEDTVRHTAGTTGLRLSGRQLLESRVDLRLLQFWLNHCDSHHQQRCCTRQWTTHLPWAKNLLLIDVQDMCIVPAPEKCPYAALSYVWGQCSNYRSRKDDFAAARQRGALRHRYLPATVQDAITVTGAIGLRYLWVDAICIIQDDDVHFQSQISQMASVYARATVTLIAAAGDDANAGLAGVRSRPKPHRPDIVKAPGVTLMSVEPQGRQKTGKTAYERTPYTTWYARAWTMQEHLFAARKLIFADDQVYWRCDEAHWVEETVLEFDQTRGYDGFVFGNDTINTYEYDLTMPERLDSHPYNQLERLGQQYLSRQLTHESDRLNAFMGVLGALTCSTGEKYVWALPESRFPAALFWRLAKQPRTLASHRKVSSGGDTVSVPIPSWSWLAWRGSKKQSSQLHFAGALDGILPLVDVYRVDSNGSRVRIGQSASAMNTEQGNSCACAYEGDFDEDLDTGYLQFWANTAPVYIQRDHEQDYSGTRYYLLRSNTSKYKTTPAEFCMGSTVHLAGNDPTVRENVPHLVKVVSQRNKTGCKKDLIQLYFVVLGRDGPGGSWNQAVTDDGSSALRALVVERKDDVAYRVGFAVISEKNWSAIPNRNWELVTLG